MTNDTLPRSLEAERAVIGATLERMDLTDRASRLSPENFTDEVLKSIWELITWLAAEHQPIDILTVSESAKGHEFEKEIKDRLPLLVGQDVPSSLHIDKYASIIETTGAKRKLAIALNRIARIAYSDGKYDPGAVFAEAIAEIQKAGEGAVFYDRERWTAAELAALEIPENPWLLDDLLIQGGLNLIAGEFASGKTFVCLDLAIAAASGGMAWGRLVETSRVLYFGADNSRSNLVRRIRDLSAGRSIDAPHDSLIFDISPLNLSEPSGMAIIREAIVENKAKVVIIDAVIRYLGSLDENSAADIGRMMAGFRDIANTTGCTIILVHHLRKLSGQLTKAKIADRIRGSGDFMGAVDSALVLTTKGQGSNLIRNIIHVKCREAEEADPIGFNIHEGENRGLVLSFEAGDAAMESETIADVAANIMASVLEKSPGMTFGKAELRSELDAVGINELSKRSEVRAFVLLKQLPSVNVGKSGRFNVYSWNVLGD